MFNTCMCRGKKWRATTWGHPMRPRQSGCHKRRAKGASPDQRIEPFFFQPSSPHHTTTLLSSLASPPANCNHSHHVDPHAHGTPGRPPGAADPTCREPNYYFNGLTPGCRPSNVPPAATLVLVRTPARKQPEQGQVLAVFRHHWSWIGRLRRPGEPSQG